MIFGSEPNSGEDESIYVSTMHSTNKTYDASFIRALKLYILKCKEVSVYRNSKDHQMKMLKDIKCKKPNATAENFSGTK